MIKEALRESTGFVIFVSSVAEAVLVQRTITLGLRRAFRSGSLGLYGSPQMAGRPPAAPEREKVLKETMKETGDGQREPNPTICGVAEVRADLQFGPLCQRMPN